MQNSVGGVRAIVLGAIALCITATLTGARAGQPTQGLKVGVIDFNKLLNDSKFAKTQMEGFNKRRGQLLVTFQAIEQNPMLNEPEQKRLVELAIKEADKTITEPETKERQTLLDRNKSLGAEYNMLLGKPVGQLNDQDRQKLVDFDNRRNGTVRRLETSQKTEMDKLQTQFGELNEAVKKRVREAVGKVAKEKNYNLVLNNEVAFYADGDLTDAAMGELNK